MRPRFQNPESIISTSAASALGAVGVNNPSTEGRPVLTINGKVVYYPGEPVRGDVKVIRNINLPFTSDSVPLYFDDNCNKPFKAKESQSFEIEVRGVRGFATKLENAKKADSDSVYRDGTTFNDGDTVWHWLEPISDLQVEDNGDIQINEGVLPIQGHPQDKYEAMKFSGGEELTADNFQAIKVMNEHMLKDFQRSALVMATLMSTGIAPTKKLVKLEKKLDIATREYKSTKDPVLKKSYADVIAKTRIKIEMSKSINEN